MEYVKSLLSDIYMALFGTKGPYKDVYGVTAITAPAELTNAQCEIIRKTIDAEIENSQNHRVWCDESGSDERILGFEEDCPDIHQWLSIDEKLNYVEQYMGRKIRSWFVMANRTSFKEGNSGSGGGFHRDSPFRNQLKLIWYLTDVNTENGPFEYIPGSHKKVHKQEKAFSLGETRFGEVDTKSVITITGEAGTLLVCDTKCVHRGRPIIEGTRYALTLYTSSNRRSKEKRVVKI